MSQDQDDLFFLIRVVQGVPQLIPINNIDILTLHGQRYYMVPEAVSAQPAGPRRARATTSSDKLRYYEVLQRVAAGLREAGERGMNKYELLSLAENAREYLGPALAGLQREKKAAKGEDGRWRISQPNGGEQP